MSLMLPTRFQAPHLLMLSLHHVALPHYLQLPSASSNSDFGICRYSPLCAQGLVLRLSSMPQLESLSIGFNSPIPTRDVETQLLHTPVGAFVTLPNLRLCMFRCGSAYLEGLLARIDIPLLEDLNIWFYNQLTFTVPHLSQFIDRTENLRFGFARLSSYQENVVLMADGDEQKQNQPFWRDDRLQTGRLASLSCSTGFWCAHAGTLRSRASFSQPW
jgi:hypothetical protein